MYRALIVTVRYCCNTGRLGTRLRCLHECWIIGSYEHFVDCAKNIKEN